MIGKSVQMITTYPLHLVAGDSLVSLPRETHHLHIMLLYTCKDYVPNLNPISPVLVRCIGWTALAKVGSLVERPFVMRGVPLSQLLSSLMLSDFGTYFWIPKHNNRVLHISSHRDRVAHVPSHHQCGSSKGYNYQCVAQAVTYPYRWLMRLFIRLVNFYMACIPPACPTPCDHYPPLVQEGWASCVVANATTWCNVVYKSDVGTRTCSVWFSSKEQVLENGASV